MVEAGRKKLDDELDKMFSKREVLMPSYDFIDGKKYYGFRAPINHRLSQYILTKNGEVVHEKFKENEKGKVESIGLWYKEKRCNFQTKADVPRPGYWNTDITTKGIKLLRGKKVNAEKAHADLLNLLKDYLFFEEKRQYEYISSWIEHTYFYKSFGVTPYLHFIGLQDAGKSTACKFLALTSFKGLFVSNPREAYIYRIGESSQPTVSFDELDKLGEEVKNAVQAVCNSGYQEGGVVPRNDQKNYATRYYNSFYPKAFSSNDYNFFSSFRTRCYQQSMIRTNEDLKDINFVRGNELERFRDIRDRLYAIGLQREEEVMNQYKNIKTKLRGRDSELLKPILTMAQLYGNEKSVLKTWEEERREMTEQGVIPKRDHLILQIFYDHLFSGNEQQNIAQPFRITKQPDNSIAILPTLKEKIHVEDPKYNPSEKSVGWTLRKLGFNQFKRRDSHGYYWTVEPENLRTIIHRWGMKELFFGRENHDSE